LPSCRVLKLVAIKEEREDLLKYHLKPGKFDVINYNLGLFN
jgi:hypothetical protein